MLDTFIRDDDQLTRAIDDIASVIDVVSVSKQFLERGRIISIRLKEMNRNLNLLAIAFPNKPHDYASCAADLCLQFLAQQQCDPKSFDIARPSGHVGNPRRLHRDRRHVL